ncbi:MAG: cytochrome c [Rubrivivax sp.]|nr:cytochrome c [Rubrivivax sp.]
MTRLLRWALALATLAALSAVAVAWLNLRGEAPVSDEPPTARAADATTRARGAQLALQGHCAGCHTAAGGAPYAGGRAIVTPFGRVYAGNLTPDVATGLGTWNADHFWRALHHGRSRDGRLLNPAFPYPNYTHISRADSDALYAWLRSLPPVAQDQPPHTLRWFAGTQPALALWRALYFRAGGAPSDPARSAELNRGATLAQGLGHCSACHAPRNALGATVDANDLSGATMPDGRWWAPSLHAADEAGVAHWPRADVVALLRDGHAPGGVALGPMATVVAGSLQHWPEADLQALAAWLQALPPDKAPRSPVEAAPAATLDAGAALYKTHCADCHGDSREGRAPAYPPLAGHRTVLMARPNNLVRAIVEGGFGPATPGHPQPYGMPPFGHVLNDEQIAALATWLRQAGPAKAAAVWPLDVQRLR